MEDINSFSSHIDCPLVLLSTPQELIFVNMNTLEQSATTIANSVGLGEDVQLRSTFQFVQDVV